MGNGGAGRWDFSDLKAVSLNCTLKRSPELSHTAGLMDVAESIMRKNGVEVAHIRVVDHPLAQGVYPDMRQHGWEQDAWPELWRTVAAADIVIIGRQSGLARCRASARLSLKGSMRCRGCPTTKASTSTTARSVVASSPETRTASSTARRKSSIHCSISVWQFRLRPTPAGSATPAQGHSYLDEGSGGLENEFTQRNTTFMTWYLMHFARMLKDAGGVPAHGNQRTGWDMGQRFDHPNPEYR